MANVTVEAKRVVTVITVVLNGAEHLESTIRSVLDSCYDNLEYIVIDGGSTDRTLEIIKRYEKRLAFWTSDKDKGIYYAMNKGWEAAQNGSYILFLGAGDRLISLPKDISLFNPDDVIYGDVELEGRQFQSRTGYQLYFSNTLHHQALLVPKNLNTSAPFDTSFKIYADFDFNQRLLKKGAHFAYCSEIKAYVLPGGLSSKKSYSEMLKVVSKNFGLFYALIAFFYLASRKIIQTPFIQGGGQ